MSDYVITDNDELRHYGVIGMKWGIHRAKKKGTTYHYKSHSTKKYERKLAKTQNKIANTSDKAKAAKLQAKADIYKNRGKRSAQHDSNMVKLARQSSLGREALKFGLFGLASAGNARMKAAGISREAAAGATAVSYLFGGPAPHLVGYIAKSNYIRQDERKKR